MRGETVTAQESGRTGAAAEEGAGEEEESDAAAAAGAAFADASSSSDSKHATRLFSGVIVKASGVFLAVAVVSKGKFGLSRSGSRKRKRPKSAALSTKFPFAGVQKSSSECTACLFFQRESSS